MHLWSAKKPLAFSRHAARLAQGMTIIEVLVASFLLILGISVVMELSNLVQKTRRLSHLSGMADRLAQDLLGSVSGESCEWNPTLGVCHNLTSRDMTSFSVWVKPSGAVEYAKPEKDDGSIEFEARFDIQTTSGCVSGVSHAHCLFNTDDTASWALDRHLFEDHVGNLHNVRVTVSYLDPFHRRVRFVSYQTRTVP
ncbi:MAG: hypothetical protein FWG75_10565 [Cystobacterineae bacterium]|nr:hypothetical protein [Cystobacterineae bacterium]